MADTQATPTTDQSSGSLTTVNPQITDAVTASNVKVLGEASAQALGSLYQTQANLTGIAAGNAVTAQQQANLIHQATTTMGVTMLYALGGATTGEASEDISKD
jgi:hypothetical protein